MINNGDKRGMITDEIKQKSADLLGYEISQEELRLMPYVFTCINDFARYNVDHIKTDEMDILVKWEEKGFIKTSDTRSVFLGCDLNFYNAIAAILWLGYATPSLAEQREKDAN